MILKEVSMAVIGFIFLVFVCSVMTFLALVIPLASGVGGVPAKKGDVVCWLFYVAIVVYSWYYVISNSPFSYTGF